MSGGSFDHDCFKITQFADDLRHEIEINNDKTLNTWGEERGWNFSDVTVEKLSECLAIIERAGQLAREVEWLYSGDHGEESFCEIIGKL